MEIFKIKRKLRKRNFIYFSSRILIRSQINLTKQQREEIFEIIRRITQNPFYGCEYQIVRSIFYKIGNPVCKVEFKPRKIVFDIKIKTYELL